MSQFSYSSCDCQIDLLSACKRTIGPTALPVTLQEIKDELDIVDDDTRNVQLINMAWGVVEQIESDARRMLMTQTWQMHLDRFPCRLFELPKFPVQSVSYVKYTTGGVLTTLSANQYQTDLVSEPARISPVANAIWPTVDYGVMNAVQIQWVAGYASALVVPRYIKNVILQAIRMRYDGCDGGDGYWAMINRIRVTGYVV